MPLNQSTYLLARMYFFPKNTNVRGYSWSFIKKSNLFSLIYFLMSYFANVSHPHKIGCYSGLIIKTLTNICDNSLFLWVKLSALHHTSALHLVEFVLNISQKMSKHFVIFTGKYTVNIFYTGWNDKIVVLKKTTLQLYFKTFIVKINSGNLII